MKSSKNWMDSILTKHKLDARKKKILTGVVVMVLLVTAVIMRLPASTATAELICGKEEHTHTDDCYITEQTLICEEEESEEHTHEESCYKTEKVLTCDKEEHTHTSDCYEQAGTLTDTTGSMDVEVAYEAGVIHEGTSLTASEVSGSALTEIQERIDEDLDSDDRVSSIINAYELTLTKDGSEVEPDGNVDVTMNLMVPGTANSEWRLYHIADNGNLIDMTNDVDIEADKNYCVTKVTFSSGGFSTYALVATESQAEEDTTEATEEEKDTDNTEEEKANDSSKNNDYPAQDFTGKANGVSVSIEAPEGAFPEGTTLEVKTVKDQDILDAAIEAADTDDAKAKAVDISFYNKDGEAIEPELPIKVTMQADVVATTGDITVVHVDEDNNGEVVEQQGQAAADEVIFEADSFSPYVIVYTVDFKFGDYEYSIEGGSSIKLSELLQVLNVKKNADGEFLTVEDIEEVIFSDETLVKVTKSGQNWILESLQPFTSDETLTLTLASGETVVIEVTDAQETTNLADTLVDAEISGVSQNSDGTYSVAAGDTFKVSLHFAESSTFEFNTSSDMTYSIPKGFIIQGRTVTTETITNEYGSFNFTYIIEPDSSGNTSGTITIQWPTDDSNPAWEYYRDSYNSTLNLDFQGIIDENVEEIKFSDSIDRVYKVDTDTDLSITKTGYYDSSDNKIHYTVTVKSTGHNKNIKVNDVFSGTLLTYEEGSLNVSSNKGRTITASPTQESDSGFTYVIDEMSNGEEVYLKYTSDEIPIGDLTKKENGTYGTYDQTNNKVTAEADTTPNKPSDEASSEEYEIRYTPLSKSAGTTTDTDDENKKILTWTIKANEAANLSMAGKTIKDTIDSSSTDVMKYYGDGITIVVRDKAKNIVGTREVSWSQLGITDLEQASTWTYTVPGDDGNYSYEITYNTIVTIDEYSNTNVKNTAEDGDGNKATGEKGVEPIGGSYGVKKSVGKIDIENKEVEWKITFDVPASGYNEKSIISEYFPHIRSSALNRQVYDQLKEGSIEISGLETEKGENYTVSNIPVSEGSDEVQGVTINFTYKDENGNEKNGLSGTGERRTITIMLKTVTSDEYLEASENQNNYAHTNYVKWENGYGTLDNQATVDWNNPNMTVTKKHDTNTTWKTNTVDGVSLPMVKFYIELNNVTDASFDENDQIILTDTFDSEYFSWLPCSDENSAKENGYPYIGSWDDSHRSSTQVITVDPDNPQKLIITLNKEDFKSDSGEIAKYCAIVYYLTVTDAKALKALKNASLLNNDGTYTLNNSVSGDGISGVTDSIEYESDMLTKTATAGTGNEVNYTLTINPDALQFGDEDMLTLTDIGENLSIDISTIEINPSLGSSWNRKDDGTIEFTIPNATSVTITYKAKVIGTGNVHYKNTAELKGLKKESDGYYNFTQSGSGGSQQYSIRALKHEDGDLMTALSGVKFKLYILGDEDTEDDRATVPSVNDGNWKEITVPAGYFVTDEDGYLRLDYHSLNELGASAHNIHAHKWYKLVEVEAPTVNGVTYQISDPNTLFWIDDTGHADYANGIYEDGDVITIGNEQVDKTKLGFTIEKQWEEAEYDDLPDEITIRLYRKSSINASNDSAVEVDVLTLKKEDFTGTTWTGTFSDLDKGYAYFIKEDQVDGYLTSYEDENTIGYIRSGVIGLSNKKQEIKVVKKWKDQYGNLINVDNGTSNPSDTNLTGIKINVYKDGKLYKNSPYTIKKSNNWELVLDDLEFPGTYTIEEISVDGYESSIVYMIDGEEAWENTRKNLSEPGTIEIDNKKTPEQEPEENTTTVTAKKKWVDSSGTELSESEKEGLEAQVQLVRYRKEKVGTTLHFVYYNGSYTEFRDSVVLSSNTDITITASENDSGWNLNPNLRDSLTGTNLEYGRESDNHQFKWTLNTGTYTDLYLVWEWNDYAAKLSNIQIEGGNDIDMPALEEDPDYEGAIITLDENNTWTGVFKNLPLAGTDESTGKIYAYSYGIKEISSSSGFKLESYSTGTSDLTDASNADEEITVTNKEQSTTEVEFIKNWTDDFSQLKDSNGNTMEDKLRILVQLQRTVKGSLDETYNAEVQEITVGNDWKYLWKDLPVKDSQGNRYQYTVKELAVYYVTDTALTEDDIFYGAETDDSKGTDSQKYYDVTEYFSSSTDRDDHKITNTLENSTDFKFTKLWRNDSNSPILWDEDKTIEVTLYGTFTYGNSTKEEAVGVYTITGNGTVPAITKSSETMPDLTVVRRGSSSYDFTVASLPKVGTLEINGTEYYGTWTYYVKETNPSEDYQPVYYQTGSDGNYLPSKVTSQAKSGETIMNKPEGAYELPETGSTGINSYLLGGTFLALISITLFLFLLGRAFLERRKSFKS